MPANSRWDLIRRLRVNDLYSSPNIVRVIKSRRVRWVGHVACMGERRSLYRFLVGKPEGKRPLGRHRHRWEDDIKMDIQEVGCGGCGLDRAGSGQKQVAGTCYCGNEPSGSIKCGEFLDQLKTLASQEGRILLYGVTKIREQGGGTSVRDTKCRSLTC